MNLKPCAVDFSEKWIKIEEVIDLVLTNGPISKACWSERFCFIYTLCHAIPESYEERLYEETKTKIVNHVQDLYVKVQSHPDENLLTEYYKHWKKYSTGVKILNGLFAYLNRNYVQRRAEKEKNDNGIFGSISVDDYIKFPTIGQLGMNIWENKMIQELKERFVPILLMCIKQDRQNLNTDFPTPTIKGVIFSLIDLNMFKPKVLSTILFEEVLLPDLIRETGEFYARAFLLRQECSVLKYMENVLNKLSEEKLRANKYLPSSLHEKVELEVQIWMIGDQLSTLNAEIPEIVKNESMKDLANAYNILKTIPGYLKCFIKIFQEHIQTRSQTIVSLNEERIPLQFVESQFEIHQKYSEMIKTLFCNNHQFIGALDKALKEVINHKDTSKNICRSPEILSRYFDNLLKKFTKDLNESEIYDKLDQGITIFKYIDDKDLFLKIYTRHFAKRLIYQQSHSMNFEEAVIKKLKETCGYVFTSKLHQMFTDMTISAEHNQKFQEFKSQEHIELGINFSVKVLQAGSWPMPASFTPFSVPYELRNAVQAFEKFYHNSFKGRTLIWLHQLSQGELKVCFTKRTYFMTMSSFQMAILLMFEKVDSFTCSELQQQTDLVDEQFYNNLKSLVDSKVLTASSKDLNEDTVVKLNFDYSNKRLKLKINLTNQKEVKQEAKQTLQTVEEDRKHYLKAVIVRIMKSRKIMKHNLLIQEVISQSNSRFIPEVPMIKRCIEVLIEKDYMERSSTSANEYSYVA